MKDRLLVIIPAFNEEANLERTLAPFLRADAPYDYVVVNDGSVDGTRKLCLTRGWRLIDMSVNTGLTYAIKAGMRYAYENDYAYALQFDADGQHEFSYIEPLFQAVRNDECDIAVGTRFLTKKPPMTARVLGGKLISLLIKLSTRQRLTDPTSGMRVYNRRMIELYARTPNINPEPDTLGYLMRCGVRVKEMQVEMHERTGGTSMFSVGASIVYMARICASLIFIQWFRKKERSL